MRRRSARARLDAGRAVCSHAALGVAAALALALAAGGCAHGSADPDESVSRDAPPASDLRLHDEPPQDAATLAVPRAGMANVRRQPFVAATPSADGRTLRVAFWGGVAPCFVLDRVDLREAGDAVTVTLYAGSDPASPDVACIEIALHMAVDVELSSPLGERIVLDGATGG